MAHDLLMAVINAIMDGSIYVIEFIPVPEGYLITINNSIEAVCEVLYTANYLFPVKTLIDCFAVIQLINNWNVIKRRAMWFYGILRGRGEVL
jgi:hypothetical protein